MNVIKGKKRKEIYSCSLTSFDHKFFTLLVVDFSRAEKNRAIRVTEQKDAISKTHSNFFFRSSKQVLM